jgi:hypothetical protein
MRTPLWLLPNVLSLDAPVIAVLWQSFFAAVFGTPVTISARVSLGLAVWAIYIADRLLDVGKAGAPVATARHRFHLKHRIGMRRLLAGVVVSAIAVVLLQVRPVVVQAGLALSAAVTVYLYCVHRGYLSSGKEFLVALLFTAGTLVAPLARSDRDLPLLTAGGAFFIACLANTVLIEAVESSTPPVASIRVLIGIAVALLWPDVGSRAVTAAALLSLSALGVLYVRRDRLSVDAFRVLADTAMLSPVPVWLAIRV